MERMRILADDYKEALIQAVMDGDEKQKLHLLRDFVVADDGTVYPKIDRAERGNDYAIFL